MDPNLILTYRNKQEDRRYVGSLKIILKTRYTGGDKSKDARGQRRRKCLCPSLPPPDRSRSNPMRAVRPLYLPQAFLLSISLEGAARLAGAKRSQRHD